MDAMEDASFWCNKAQDLENEAVERHDQLAELAIRIVQKACDNLTEMADKYWDLYSGTFLAIQEHDRLKKEIEEYLGTNDPLNKGRGNELLKEHKKWGDKLCFDLCVLESDVSYVFPSILEDGFPMPQQKWRSFFIDNMLSGFSELKTTEDMAHHVSVARDKMALHEFTMHVLSTYVYYYYNDEEYAKHLCNVSRFLAD
jgi:hypothetical protein